ncbi:hypothetical protein QOZ98_000074 [Planomicrobium stackebrandtii]|uniref:Uncharacterized protein n=1 Tax=Planomicrobium stackebrandtii TaxID=253160 RepID=A0ABU0GPG1_9BACL|nr:hypothetical protein [Planomicrobium stackebrandtii]
MNLLNYLQVYGYISNIFTFEKREKMDFCDAFLSAFQILLDLKVM